MVTQTYKEWTYGSITLRNSWDDLIICKTEIKLSGVTLSKYYWVEFMEKSIFIIYYVTSIYFDTLFQMHFVSDAILF